ncbi:TPA: hypothetical protein DCY43_04130 [candidate division WWE3 bacterium]|uniref:Cell division protein FtsX n=3 Tax=Katanobacteria TaxID=422282 RepID=A0A1F4V4C6_UNCKA|nr:MAG: hypothetical protein UW65_C0045G0008 [candidate division WWE3 bacterium GW2011_GWB1_44_4]OGC52052.1 MAG: hypothetical protein A2709_02855 [candidate division WWE3 bacterium RIFCSPHIGHO2_01_FULL_43_9]HAZ29896.1 hypothetical protein [candidate division WWE3 bacterium]
MPKALTQTMETVKQEKLFTVSNLVVMILTFLVFGLFLLVEVLAQTALNKLEKEATLTLFFKDEAAESAIMTLKSSIEKDTRVFSVNYVSKADAFEIFKNLNKDEPLLLESVTANVLPASLEIRAHKVGLLAALADEYKTTDGVEGVKFYKDIIDRFNFWRTVLSVGIGVILLILLFVSFSIVVSTIRTAISLRGSEFEILKLVGASDAYVKNPLLHQGMFYGGVSAFVSGAVYAVLIVAGHFSGVLGSLRLSEVVLASDIAVPTLLFPVIMLAFLTVCGLGLGYLSSLSAIKRYLNY